VVPLKYNFRNLRARWVTTVMTVLAIALVVFISVLTFGMAQGVEHSLRMSGDPLDLIVMRQGSNTETDSGIEQSLARQVATLEGIDRDASGQPLCSVEFVTILTKPRRNNRGTTNIIVRGLEPIGRQLRPGFRIVEGRDVRSGVNEAITSRKMAERFQNLALGEKLEINKGIEFTVVGYFEAAGSSAESEVWTDLRDLTSARRTPGAVSIVNLRATGADARDALKKRLLESEQFNLEASTETEYYEEQMSASILVQLISYVLAGFLTFGAMFAAANTMYAAVASRGREIGTLRALGFSRRSILGSFLLESVMICLAGGLIGCLATLPLSGLSSGTANWNTFSELTFEFRFGPNVLARGVIMALGMGAVGGLFPAIRAVRLRITDALRQN
jgi:putative ABC transport system permease protein